MKSVRCCPFLFDELCSLFVVTIFTDLGIHVSANDENVVFWDAMC